jgi:uncharacterized protein YbjT (DUF2867 family)
MSKLRICILGGTGFVGQHLCARLASEDHTLRVLTRRRERHRDLLVLPTVEVVEANVYDSKALVDQFSGMDAVINLIGVLHDDPHAGRGFQQAHVELARKVLEAATKAGVKRLLHMSALHADSGKGSSRYLRSKGEAENIAHNTTKIAVTSFRPAVMFGPGDSFLNRFAGLLRLTPRLAPFLLPCPNARFAPVYVGDVVSAMAQSLSNKQTFGKRYDLCGPKAYTLRELVQLIAQYTATPRTIVGLGDGFSKFIARLPGKFFTIDNFNSMKTDSVCSQPFPPVFQIEPTPLESIAPHYLGKKSVRKRLFNYRTQAKR